MSATPETSAGLPIPDEPISRTESAPLLGDPGDVLQRSGESLVPNLYTGTAWLAQAGILLLVALVWAAVFRHPLLPLFSPHPLLQSLGIFVLVQAILVLQPTAAPTDKVRGARVHGALQLLSLVLFAAGISLIEANKIRSHGVHLHSAHGVLGVITAVVLLGQYVFGFLIWAAPVGLFGRVDRAKALYKQHRWTGYAVLLPLLLATALTATATDYNVNVLDIRTWAVLVAAVLIVVGVYPRIHGRKLGLWN
ncbi:cytochrome b561-like protein [Grosmannia clavigera kw1407]|uniref:Cytochrome b561-like protein n=1 Tax=Grosmannia clavigera (strain kw1407 / UAMH 11150) TaxID=655863 RepID=F0XTZ8_GROCL|nr:cytochrome b561-like protein [Grosmannia clavigera kw1407]EFW98729.1 cytochrome b561-like protein [Grosmannia clavigera kw1407]